MAATVATYRLSRMVEHPKSKSTQPRYSTTRVTQYISQRIKRGVISSGNILKQYLLFRTENRTEEVCKDTTERKCRAEVVGKECHDDCKTVYDTVTKNVTREG